MGSEGEPQKRNAEATAERIRKCARRVFHEKGYDAATTREIADCAGVNIALISRYFGSKQGLFEDAVLPFLSLERFKDEPVESLADRLTEAYVNTTPKESFDPFVVLLRSVASPDVGPLMIDALERQAVIPLSKAIGGRNAEARAMLIATQLAGLILRFRIFRQPPKSSKEKDAIRHHLRDYFETLIKGDQRPSARLR